MKQDDVIEVGLGEAGPPSIMGGGQFQNGAAWMFAQVRDGKRVRMRFGVDGLPVLEDYLVIALDPDDLEKLGLIEEAYLVEEATAPWDHNYGDVIREFLFANSEALANFIEKKTGDDLWAWETDGADG